MKSGLNLNKGKAAPITSRLHASVRSVVSAQKVSRPWHRAPLAPRAEAPIGGHVSAPAPIPASTSRSAVANPLKVVVAGGGIGGLLFAVAALKQGFDVKVLERDLTAIRGEGKYRGPIQVQSNALAAIEAIDLDTAEMVLREGCVTGDRINGLCDGRTGEWYCKFDTFHPAADKGLPVTRVISRMTLQEILAENCRRLAGRDSVIENSRTVVSFEEGVDPSTGREGVAAVMDNGERVWADVLIGADGIWSKLRTFLVGESKPHYSGYTCYTGISDFMPHDIDTVGYRVFLGSGKYFVSSDVGGGKVQWYGFHNEAAGGSDTGSRKARLLDIFGDFSSMVTDLIRATPEDDVLRRDIYDRPPIFKWSEGRVALLGDAAHAMQPNLGQGGCMAIEDAHSLALILAKHVGQSDKGPAGIDVKKALGEYQSERMMRAAAIHGMAGMAAIMASTYKTYLGHGISEQLERLRIPHPGKVVGQVALTLTMPAVLDWVLGGNVGSTNTDSQRPLACRLEDAPKTLPAEKEHFARYLTDDHLLTGAAKADWVLVHEAELAQEGTGYTPPRGLELGTCQGDSADVAELRMREGEGSGAVCATVVRAGGRLHLRSAAGAKPARLWVNGRRLASGETVLLNPSDTVRLGSSSAPLYHVRQRHVSLARTSDKDAAAPHHVAVVAPLAAAHVADTHHASQAKMSVAAPGVSMLGAVPAAAARRN